MSNIHYDCFAFNNKNIGTYVEYSKNILISKKIFLLVAIINNNLVEGGGMGESGRGGSIW